MSGSKTRTQKKDMSWGDLKFGEFEKLPTSSDARWYALWRPANNSDSTKLLEEAGLRPLTYKEALSWLVSDKGLVDSLKGLWFYLEEEQISKHGFCTVCKDGDIVEVETGSLDNTVHVSPGKKSVVLSVISDNVALDKRFNLDATYDPMFVVPIVIGVPKERSEVSKLLR